MGQKNFKIIKQKNEHYILLKSEKGQCLNLSDMEYINNHAINGLLRMQVEQKKHSFTIRYHITGLCSLNEYLRTTTLNKWMFGQLLEHVLAGIREVERQMDKDKLVTDLKYVMVNSVTREVRFMYLPVQYWDGRADFCAFCRNLVYAQKTNFAQNEDTSYVREFLTITQKGIGLSLVDLEAYVTDLNGQKDKKEQKRCVFCNRNFPIYQKFCSICGNSLDAPPPVYEPAVQKLQSSVSESNKESKSDSDTEAALMGEIYCERTGGSYKLLRQQVCIGRSVHADVRIEGNLNLGRMHAYLKKENGKIYIKDNHSTNGTFVEKKKLEPEQWTLLPASGEFQLSNETLKYREI